MGDRRHNRHGPKIGEAVPLLGGAWSPSNTDRQQSDSIGQTILQTVVQKSLIIAVYNLKVTTVTKVGS